MINQYLYKFKKDLSKITIPKKINNPFALELPKIAKIAAKEFQEFIFLEASHWDYDFETRQGKMFGVLVVQKQDDSYAYLGTTSGELSRKKTCEKFIPPVFDESTGNYFLNKEMTEITLISKQIKNTKIQEKVKELRELRSQKSRSVQKKLFEHYEFINIHGELQNLLQIFNNSKQGKPPAATGECAAPKLLQYALKNDFKPIALAEFWWGNPPKGNERKHKMFYPSCKNKCRPILEYMLDDTGLYDSNEFSLNC